MTCKPWDEETKPINRDKIIVATPELVARAQAERRREPRERMASMERLLTELIGTLKKLKRGQCWCEVYLGTPTARIHTEACQEVQALFERARRGELR